MGNYEIVAPCAYPKDGRMVRHNRPGAVVELDEATAKRLGARVKAKGQEPQPQAPTPTPTPTAPATPKPPTPTPTPPPPAVAQSEPPTT